MWSRLHACELTSSKTLDDVDPHVLKPQQTLDKEDKRDHWMPQHTLALLLDRLEQGIIFPGYWLLVTGAGDHISRKKVISLHEAYVHLTSGV